MSYHWSEFAACKGMDLAIWFPEYPSGRMTPLVAARVRAVDDQAKAVCATCPVFEQCREWATTYPEIHGTWAGVTAPERAAMNCATRSSIGVSGRYMAHRRNGEPICDTCKAGHNERTQKLRSRAKAKLPVMWWRPTVSRSA